MHSSFFCVVGAIALQNDDGGWLETGGTKKENSTESH